jgi:hypothetical protein
VRHGRRCLGLFIRRHLEGRDVSAGSSILLIVIIIFWLAVFLGAILESRMDEAVQKAEILVDVKIFTTGIHREDISQHVWSIREEKLEFQTPLLEIHIFGTSVIVNDSSRVRRTRASLRHQLHNGC